MKRLFLLVGLACWWSGMSLAAGPDDSDHVQTLPMGTETRWAVWERAGGWAVLHSADAGKTWRNVAPPGPEWPRLKRIEIGHDTELPSAQPEIFSRGGDTIWLAAGARPHDAKTVLLERTDDGGVTWKESRIAVKAPPSEVALRNGLNGVVQLRVATDPGGDRPDEISWLVSKDGGDSWEAAPAPVTKDEPGGGIAQEEAIGRNSAKGSSSWLLWCAEKHPTLLKSTDDGKTWRDISPDFVGALKTDNGTMPVLDLFALDDARAWIAYSTFPDPTASDGSKTVVQRTDDGGATWVKSSFEPENGAGDTDLYLQFCDRDNGYLVQTAFISGVRMRSNAARTKDGGKTWQPIDWPDPSTTGMTFRTVQEGWAGAYHKFGSVFPFYQTRDAGHTWAEVKLPLPSVVNGQADWHGATSPPVFLDAEKREGRLPVKITFYQPKKRKVEFSYQTHDGGATWELPPEYR